MYVVIVHLVSQNLCKDNNITDLIEPSKLYIQCNKSGQREIRCTDLISNPHPFNIAKKQLVTPANAAHQVNL